MAKKNKGKKNASAPAPPTKLTPKLDTPAWVLDKEKKDREEEEARIAAMDLHPGSTVSASSSSSKILQSVIALPAPYEREGLRRLPLEERPYDSDCGSDSAPEW
ncbi:hypothetical protein BDD12DRAFT_811029 [Trichophaea hybrida]|nr:hypothetical protein BDD12DRAFT_811029 [Trichophaea hybrida]